MKRQQPPRQSESRWVGIYYMPIYTEADLADVFKPGLLKLLKGKSCFRIWELDDELEAQVEDALQRGHELAEGLDLGDTPAVCDPRLHARNPEKIINLNV